MSDEAPPSTPIQPSQTIRAFRAADDRGLLAEVTALRVSAWRASCAFPSFATMTVWEDDHDDHAWHWAAFMGPRLVGAARLTVHREASAAPDHSSWGHLLDLADRSPVGMISRLVVDPSARHLGLVAEFDGLRLAAARRLGVRFLLAVASTRRVDSLRRLAFEEIGRFEYVAGPLVDDKDNVLLAAQLG